MGEEKKDCAAECETHMFGRIAAVLSILFLVPVIRRFRAQRQQHKASRRHFPIFGH